MNDLNYLVASILRYPVLAGGEWLLGGKNTLPAFPGLELWFGGCLNRRAARCRALSMMNDDFPHISLDALARNDNAAWNAAYTPLYREIWIVLKARLLPGFGIDLEDLAVAIITDEIMPGLRDRATDSFREMKAFGDLVRVAKKIAACRAVDAIRRVMRKKEDALPEDWENLVGAEEAVIDPNHEGFWRRVNRLKPPKPGLFADYFIGGMSYPEIAKKWAMPIGTVCSHFKRGLDELAAGSGEEETES